MEQEVHNKENCWKTSDGEYIPFSEMTNSHLRNAKHFAQSREEYFWYKSCQMTEIVVKLDQEAERRGIVLKDRKARLHKNNKMLKDAIAKM